MCVCQTFAPQAKPARWRLTRTKIPVWSNSSCRNPNGVSRKRKGVLVTEHRLGFVSANAGIDQSNIEAGDEAALLLPHDPDESAADIRAKIKKRRGIDVAVIISDTHGRAFRVGNVGVAIGAAGLPSLSKTCAAAEISMAAFSK